MADPVRFEITNSLSELSTIARVAKQFASDRQLGSKVLYLINLVLDEIVTNIVSYGFQDDRPHRIAIVLDLEGSVLTLEIEDDGRPFNIVEAPGINVGLPLEDRPVGGLGCHLVRKMMDEVRYERRAHGNHLHLTKNIRNLESISCRCSRKEGTDG